MLLFPGCDIQSYLCQVFGYTLFGTFIELRLLPFKKSVQVESNIGNDVSARAVSPGGRSVVFYDAALLKSIKSCDSRSLGWVFCFWP